MCAEAGERITGEVVFDADDEYGLSEATTGLDVFQIREQAANLPSRVSNLLCTILYYPILCSAVLYCAILLYCNMYRRHPVAGERSRGISTRDSYL